MRCSTSVGGDGPGTASGLRLLERAYPYGLARLRDVSAGVSPQQSATLGGTYAPASQIRQRLAGVTRLWVVEWAKPKPVPVLHGLGFTLVRSWDTKGLRLRLFVARGRPQPGAASTRHETGLSRNQIEPGNRAILQGACSGLSGMTARIYLARRAASGAPEQLSRCSPFPGSASPAW